MASMSGSLPPPEELPPPPTQLPANIATTTKNSSPESSEFEFVNNAKTTTATSPAPNDMSKNPSLANQPVLPVTSTSPQSPHEESKITTHEAPEGAGDSGLFGWVKGASGGLLSKVAEKTKSSVETMITTLDPQMKDYIYSGGDIQVVLTSNVANELDPIRDAFQTVFGRATVVSLPAPPALSVADQPVGFAAGRQGANEKIQQLRSKGDVRKDVVVMAVESFLLEVGEQTWVEMSCLVLSDPSNSIELTAYSQPTPVNERFVEMARQETAESYPKRWSGFSTRIGTIIGKEWDLAGEDWHETVCGVTRPEILFGVGKTMAGLYKRSLANVVARE